MPDLRFRRDFRLPIPPNPVNKKVGQSPDFLFIPPLGSLKLLPARCQFFQHIIQRHAVSGHKQQRANGELKQIIHKGDVLPVCRHKGIVAACERDGEKQQRVQRVAHKRGRGGRNPPRFEAAQFVEHENVHHLPEGIGGEAGQRDA